MSRIGGGPVESGILRQMHREATIGIARRLCARPERVVWAVAEHDGKRSVCPLGWKMNTSGRPPMMAISVAPQRFTHGLIERAGEFVLAWPGEDLAEATLYCGTHSGRDVDKFAAAHLTPMPGAVVRAPLVRECIVNLECRVVGRLSTGDHTIFAGEIVAAWATDTPKRLLCSVGDEAGYEVILERGGYRLGVIRR